MFKIGLYRVKNVKQWQEICGGGGGSISMVKQTDPFSAKCPANCFHVHLWGSSLHTQSNKWAMWRHRPESEGLQMEGSYRGSGVNSLTMPSAPSVMPWTMKVLPIPFHKAFTPWTHKWESPSKITSTNNKESFFLKPNVSARPKHLRSTERMNGWYYLWRLKI